MYFTTFVLKNLLRRPVRTALTVLGLAVAVGSMIALLGISHNVTQSVEDLFEKRGIDLMVTAAGQSDQLASDMRQEMADQARRTPGVEAIAPALITMADITRSSGAVDPVLIQGWVMDSFAFDTITIEAGRRLLPGDTRKAMLGTTLAENTRKGVGSTILLFGGEPFEVVGVYRSFNVFENGSVVVPLAEAQLGTGRKGRITGFSVRVDQSTADSKAQVEAVKQRLTALRDPTEPALRLAAQTTQEYVDNQTHLKIVRAMTWMVSIVALAIGVISMLNTMVMSVLERTHEIGILRAVGWPRGRVVAMILGESILLGLAAAVVGGIGAWVVTYILTQFPKVNGFIEAGIAPVILAEGLGLAALIGFVGGAYPAFRAARLLPTEAIRHD